MPHEHNHGAHGDGGMDDILAEIGGEALSSVTADEGKPNNVNLILHGLIIIVQRPRLTEILIPNLGIEHVSRVGTFLAEETLAARSCSCPYLLTGVAAGNAKVPTADNVVLSGCEYDPMPTQAQLYARIVTPRPRAIVSMRRTKSKIKADVDPLGLFDGRHTHGVQILSFFAPDLNKVRLRPHKAPLGIHEKDGRDFINVHVLCEPDSESHENHNVHGLDSALNLLPPFRGTVRVSERTTLEDPDPKVLPPGCHAIETLSVIERSKVLAKAGMAWRNDKPFPEQGGIPMVGTPPLECAPFFLDIS